MYAQNFADSIINKDDLKQKYLNGRESVRDSRLVYPKISLNPEEKQKDLRLSNKEHLLPKK